MRKDEAPGSISSLGTLNCVFGTLFSFCCLASKSPNVVPTIPHTSAKSTRLAAMTWPLCRRTNLLTRYPILGGRASTTSSAR